MAPRASSGYRLVLRRVVLFEDVSFKVMSKEHAVLNVKLFLNITFTQVLFFLDQQRDSLNFSHLKTRPEINQKNQTKTTSHFRQSIRRTGSSVAMKMLAF